MDIEPAYLEKIQSGYFDYIRQQTGMRILIIDTNRLDFVNIPDHFELLYKLILDDYPPGTHTITP
jgi:deoxyadenosine/deoxycytidine kinase